MCLPVFSEGIEESLRALLTAAVAAQKGLGLSVADEVKLDQHRRHTRGPQHEEAGLTDSFVITAGRSRSSCWAREAKSMLRSILRFCPSSNMMYDSDDDGSKPWYACEKSSSSSITLFSRMATLRLASLLCSPTV